MKPSEVLCMFEVRALYIILIKNVTDCHRMYRNNPENNVDLDKNSILLNSIQRTFRIALEHV